MTEKAESVDVQRTAKINAHAEDKISLGKDSYSWVTVGGSITREVPDTGDTKALQDELRQCFLLVEEIVAEERSNVLRGLQAESAG